MILQEKCRPNLAITGSINSVSFFHIYTTIYPCHAHYIITIHISLNSKVRCICYVSGMIMWPSDMSRSRQLTNQTNHTTMSNVNAPDSKIWYTSLHCTTFLSYALERGDKDQHLILYWHFHKDFKSEGSFYYFL